jgi:tight adherence protein B
MFVMASRPNASAQEKIGLKERLATLSVDPSAAAKEIEMGMSMKNMVPKVDVLKNVVGKLTGDAYLASLEADLAQASIPIRVYEFIILRVLVSAGIGAAIYFRGFSPAIAAGVGVGSMLLGHIPVIKIMKGMRISKFTLQLAEFLVLITNSLRAGQTFLQGVEIAAGESPNPIGMEFRQMLKETKLGVPVEQAFSNMLVRVPSEELKIVMSAFTIQRNVGGNLAEIMEQVAATIRQRIQIQGQIKVLTTQGKLSGMIVGLLPIGLLCVFAGISPDTTSLLWKNVLGQIMLGIGAFLQLLGAFVIYKICDIEV